VLSIEEKLQPSISRSLYDNLKYLQYLCNLRTIVLIFEERLRMASYGDSDILNRIKGTKEIIDETVSTFKLCTPLQESKYFLNKNNEISFHRARQKLRECQKEEIKLQKCLEETSETIRQLLDLIKIVKNMKENRKRKLCNGYSINFSVRKKGTPEIDIGNKDAPAPYLNCVEISVINANTGRCKCKIELCSVDFEKTLQKLESFYEEIDKLLKKLDQESNTINLVKSIRNFNKEIDRLAQT